MDKIKKSIEESKLNRQKPIVKIPTRMSVVKTQSPVPAPVSVPVSVQLVKTPVQVPAQVEPSQLVKTILEKRNIAESTRVSLAQKKLEREAKRKQTK